MYKNILLQRKQKQLYTTESEKRAYIPAFDGVRAISISFVIAAHLSIFHALPTYLRVGPLGLTGVRIFFVLSGFLITSQLVREKRITHHVNIPKFLWRRLVRLGPAMWFVISVSLLLSHFGYVNIGKWDPLIALTYTADLIRMSRVTLGHFWSLSLEEQFYFCWPILILKASYRRTSSICLVLVIMCPLIRAIELSNGSEPFEFTLRPEACIDSIALGSLMALRGTELARKYKGSIVGFLGIAVILISGYFTRHHYWFNSIGPTIESFAAAILLLNVKDGTNLISRVLSCGPLVWGGQISYSIYLWQQLYIFSSLPANPALAFRFPFSLLMVFASAVVSFYLIESPLRILGRRLLDPYSVAKTFASIEPADTT